MKSHHALVAGDSGGGKTTLLRELHVVNDPSIWINHNREDVPTGHQRDDATSVRSLPELKKAIAAGKTTINYRVDNQKTGVRHARSIGYHRTDSLQVIVDEAQNILPDNAESDNPLKQGMHEDRDEGIYYRVASQDPGDIDSGALKQCAYYVWVGEWATFHQGFFRYFNVPTEELPTEPYRYVVLNKRMGVVYRGRTKQEFS